MKKSRSLKVIWIVSFLIILNVGVQSVSAIDWSSEMMITWDPLSDQFPSTTRTSDGKIWFVWHSDRISGNTEIFYKVYDPSKVNPWSLDTRLTYRSGIDATPTVMQAADGKIWVVWNSKQTTTYQIYYKTYNGTHWSPDTLLPAQAESYLLYPSILQAANGTIWVFWTSMRTEDMEIYYKTSNNNGASWSSDTLLTAISSPSDDDWDPAVTQANDGKIWLTWSRTDDIFYTFFNGVSWSSAASVYTASTNDWHPSITQAADGKIWVVWDSASDPPATANLYYNVYDGSGWQGAIQLTTDEGNDNMPSITRASDDTLWVTWCSDRPNGHYDLYYKTNTLAPPHDIAIFSVLPMKSVVTQGKSVKVQVVAQNLGTSNETFNIDLYANTTKVGSQNGISLSSGQLYPFNITWNTLGFPLGICTIKANATITMEEANPADNTYIDGNITLVTHNVVITNVTTSVTQGYKPYTTVRIYVEIKNEGTISEIVTVTAYRNSTVIGIQTPEPLDPGATSILTFFFFTWYPPDLAYDNYNITARMTPIPDETNYADNYKEDGIVKLTIPGDVNCDKKVDVFDLALISAHWYPDPPEGPLGYDPNVDINADYYIDIGEIEIASSYWGLSW